MRIKCYKKTIDVVRGFLLRESIELCRFNALKMITVEALYSINIR